MEVDFSDKSNTNVLNVDTLLVNEKNEDPKASDIDSKESSTQKHLFKSNFPKVTSEK